MIKSVTAAVCALALTTTLAFAQTSQPQGGANQSPTSPTANDSMKKDGMMKNETSGMSKDSMGKDGMKKDTSKDNKPVDGMKK